MLEIEKNNILLHAQLSNFAYLDTFDYAHNKVDIIKIVKKEVGCSWIFTDRLNNVHIAFRGSESIKDLLNNINMTPTPFYNDLGDVHSGYFDYYKAYRNTLIEYIFHLKKHKKLNDISTCGHSSGSLIGEMLAIDLAYLMKEKITSYSYGAPPIGDSVFAKNFQSLPNLKSYKIMNEHDFVKNIPSPFVHVQKQILIRETIKDKNPKQWSLHPNRIIKDHSIKTYIRGIKKFTTV